MSQVDLHVHTTASDGTCSPKEVMELALSKNIKYMAITDHDTMAGVPLAMEMASSLNVCVIPGIEISAGYKGVNTHLLGYGMNPEHEAMRPVLEYVQKSRILRNQKMVQRMKEDGVDITYEAMVNEFGMNLGRPHFAKVLIRQGFCASIQEAFDLFLTKGKKYYIHREHISMQEAIDCIHKAGGVAILAHPYQYKYDSQVFLQFLKDEVEMGVDGIEVYYSGYNDVQKEYLLNFAKEKGLIVTGGSDFHGTIKPHISFGGPEVPASCALDLLQKIKENMTLVTV